MKTIASIIALTMMACAVGTDARADTLFYGGDASFLFPNSTVYRNEAYNDANPFGDNFQTYDYFTVPTGQTWYVTGMFSNIGNPDMARNPHPLANWFIRSGESTASPGSLLASGTSTADTTTTTTNGVDLNRGGLPGDDAIGELLSLDLGQTVELTGGNAYWFAVQPISTSTRHMFVGATADNVYSEGLTGSLTAPSEQPVPEPVSAALLATFLLGGFCVRRMARG